MQAFSFVDGVETQLTSGVVFTVSNKQVALIGVNSGNLTGVGQGIITVTATYQGITATAMVTVLPGLNCCEDTSVATMLVLDKSKSMTLDFGSGYAKKQDFANAVASAYASQTNQQKDTIGLITFNYTPTVDDTLTSDKATVAADALATLPTQALTTLASAIGSATEILLASTADFKVMVLITDGEDHPTNPATFDPSLYANIFKTAGGILICVGVRAHGQGFNLLSVLSTGGFFVNAHPSVVDEAIQAVYALKGYTCAGNCSPPGNIYQNEGALDYTDFINWTVTAGHVDLFAPDLFDVLPGNGSYVSMVSNIAPYTGELTSNDSFTFTAGETYRISFYLAGNQRMDLGNQNLTVKIGDGTVFSQIVSIQDFEQNFTKFSYNFTPQVDVTGQLIFTELGNNAQGSYFGLLLDNIAIENITDITTEFTENFDDENLQYVPPACGVGVTSGGGTTDDPDVLAFVAATGISNTTQIDAVRKFVLSLKSNSLWSKFDALYPFMGSSASEHSYNLKNPALYQITWNGTVAHGLNTIQGDGATGYGNTGFNPSTAGGQFSLNSASLGAYCNTIGMTGTAESFMGCADASNTSTIGEDQTFNPPCIKAGGLNSATTTLSANQADFRGHTIFTRTSAGTQQLYLPDGTSQAVNVASVALPNVSMYILALNASGIAGAFGNMSLSLAYIASAFSPSEISTLKTIINSLISLEGTSFTPGAGYSYYYGYNCYGYGCASEPPGVQQPDPFPLPDIETNFVPPTTYTSTRSYTALCPSGTSQIGPASSVPVMTSATAPSGEVTTDNETTGFEAWRAFGTGPAWVTTTNGYIQYEFVTPITAVAFAVTPFENMLNVPVQMSIQGSEDGSTFEELGNYETSFFNEERVQFAIPSGSINFPSLDMGPYVFYRLVISASSDNGSTFVAPVGIALLEILVANANTGITKSATETSQISQADANAKANAAAQAEATDALALTGCVTVYTSTQSYTAQCPVGSLGPAVTKSATEQSVISQQAADNAALASAQESAEDDLNCGGSNNTSQMYAVSSDGVPAKARTGSSINDPEIYPAIRFISGQTGVITRIRATLKSFAANSPDFAHFLLVSPAGKAVSLMCRAGGTTLVPFNAPVDLLFDSNSVNPLPSPPVAGTYQPANPVDPNLDVYPTPAPQSGYLSSFATLVGDSPNGAWALWFMSFKATGTSAESLALGFELVVDSA